MAAKKKKKARKKHAQNGGGRPVFVPTDEKRKLVTSLIGYGLTRLEICDVLRNPSTGKPISVNTLKKHFEQEIETGESQIKAKLYHSIYKKALSDDHPQAAACAMFILKCRYGWRQADRVIHEFDANTGVLVVPAGVTPQDWINAQHAKNAKKKAPKHDDD